MKPKFTTKEIVSALQDIYSLDVAIFDHLVAKGFVDKETYGKNMTTKVELWLNERDYVWETMSEQEKWELEMFMRVL